MQIGGHFKALKPPKLPEKLSKQKQGEPAPLPLQPISTGKCSLKKH
jgi:hypothetical protein